MNDSLIVALDVDSLEKAKKLVTALKPHVSIFKIGLRLFTLYGPDVVKMVQDHGAKVFLDLKFHDIPNTVRTACEAAARLNIYMMNVHASGGREMMEAAAKGLKAVGSKSILLGVTVLTSQEGGAQVGPEVQRLARLSQEAGLGGVVCSPQEIEIVRKACGKDFVIVTPGVRPSFVSSIKDDQKRTATPKEALQKGANYLVVGRPILEAKDPVQATQSILSELS